MAIDAGYLLKRDLKINAIFTAIQQKTLSNEHT